MHVNVPKNGFKDSSQNNLVRLSGFCVRDGAGAGFKGYMQAATIASHRFGYTETSLRAVQPDPRGWVLDQFRQPSAMDASGLIDSVAAMQLAREVLKGALQAKPDADGKKKPDDALGPATPSRLELRRTNMKGLQRRWQHIVATPTPVAERWVQFRANHF
jgi:hypothetical protein